LSQSKAWRRERGRGEGEGGCEVSLRSRGGERKERKKETYLYTSLVFELIWMDHEGLFTVLLLDFTL